MLIKAPESIPPTSVNKQHLFWACVLTAISLCGAPATAANTTERPPKLPPLHLEGTLGRDLPIVMDLQFHWSQSGNGDWFANAEGTYCYKKYNRDIYLRGSRTQDHLWLSELNEDGAATGTFEGDLTSPDTFSGSWQSADGKRTLPFTLRVAEHKIGVPKKSRTSAPTKAETPPCDCIFTPVPSDPAKAEDFNRLWATADCNLALHDTLPTFHFHVKFYRNYRMFVEISKAGQHEPFQSLQVTEFRDTPTLGPFTALEALDMNFDGYKDIRIAFDSPPSGNFSYRVWLFDPATGRFVPNSALSALPAAVFDPETETVHWHWHMSASERHGGISHVDHNGKVTPISERITELSDDKRNLIETIKEFRDGKMEVVSKNPVD